MRRTSRTTTRTLPDGTTVSTTTEKGGCCGCGWLFWALVVLFVLAVPTEFPLWGEILAYTLEGLMAVGAVATWVQRRQGK